MLTEREDSAKSEAFRKVAFDRWMDEPLTRMAISMIPAGENADALRLLLQSAHGAGFAAGGADFAMLAMTAMLGKKPPPPEPMR